MSIIKISELPAATSPVSPSDVAAVVQGGVTKKAAIDQLGFIAAGTGANPLTIQNKLRETISVKDFGAVGNNATDDTVAINNAIAATAAVGGTLYFPPGTYRTSSTLNMRFIGVDAPNATISGNHLDIVVILGNNSASASGPNQYINQITRVSGTTSTPTARILGAKGQYITIERCEYVQLYADTDSATTTSIAYSSFWFRYVSKLELATNPAPLGSTTQWINENQFYLNRTSELLVSGTYSHNNNHFWAGTFESNSVITFNVGRSNWVHNARLEGGSTITFAADATDCVVINSWVSSSHRYPTGSVTVINNGEMCSYVSAYDAYYPYTSYVGFSYETLKKVSTDYNVLGVSNVTINATNLTVGSNDYFYESPFIPVGGKEKTIFTAEVINFSGGIRLYVDGYDSSKTLITPADNQVLYDGVGARQFQQVDASVNTSDGRVFYILDPNCAYIKLRARGSGVSTTFDAFEFGMRANTTLLSRQQAGYMLTSNNFV